MKWLVLSIILAAGLFFLIQNAFAENTYLDNYNNSKLVLAGKVLSLEQRHNQTAYEIQVEKYYKNPQSAKVIAVFGPAKGIYFMHDPTFEVGDRLFLYLEKRDGVWSIQDPSFKLQYNCDASVLVPPTFDAYLHDMPASDDSPTFSDPDFIGDIHKVGKKMQIKYIVYNYTPFLKRATVTLLVNGTNQNKTVFSDQKTVVVPACNGSVPLEWSFTPQRADDYVAQAQVTAGYDIPYSLMIINEPYVANSFQVRENVAGGSIDRTVYPIIQSPLQQFKSGIPIERIQCKEGLMLVKKSDNSPACIKSSSLSELNFRRVVDCVWNCSIPIPVKHIHEDKTNPTMVIDGKSFYYYVINETLNSAQGEGKKITFHDVIFTLFPRPFFMNLGGYCGSGSLGTSILFPDGIRESLKINIPQSECMDKFAKDDLIKLTNHTDPQAGLAFFDGGVRLLVSSVSSDHLNENTIKSNPACADYTSNEFPLGKSPLSIMPERLVFFVKANSSAQLCVRYTSEFPNNGTLPILPQVYTGSDSTTYSVSSDIEITTQPTEIPLEYGSNTVVEYTVSAHEKTGVYWIFLSQLCTLVPVVVWSDTPDVSPLDIPLSTGPRSCPMQVLDAKIVGSEGGILDYKPALLLPQRTIKANS